LDPAASRLFRESLKESIENGGTILVSTHVLEIAERFSDMVTILNEGRVVAQGTLSELKAKAGMGRDTSLEDAFLVLTGGEANQRKNGVNGKE
jgi:ABC-2 type transport system ATP-binding protein